MGQVKVLTALLSLLPQITRSQPCETQYPPLMQPLQSRQFSNNLGAVASESEICSTIGVNILRDGGNAADAMVATVLCVGTVGKRIQKNRDHLY
jgi:gamma-glutamyltranspeptidase/glutathione hydrolase